MLSSSSVALALSMFVSVMAQSDSESDTTLKPTGSVIQVTFPGGLDPQTLVGSLVAVQSQVTTVVVTCPPGTDSNDCGFYPPITITAGPSTLAFTLSELENSPPVTQQCNFSPGGGLCTYIGIDNGGSTSGSTITTETSTLAASEIVSVPVTITAGATGGSGSTNTPNDAKILVPGGFAAALMGFAAVYL